MNIDKKQLEKKLNAEVKEKVSFFREKYNIEEKPITNINSLAFAKEFFIIKFPFNGEISGAYLVKKGRNKIYKCIYINTNEPIGRINYSFFHEVYHAFFEKSNTNTSEYNQKDDPIEKKANKFASNILIPRSYLSEKLKEISMEKDNWIIKMEDIFELQRIFNVSFQALIYAISELSDIKPKNIKSFFKYYNKKHWDELEKKSLEYGITLNSSEPKIEWPKGFKENIIRNISDGLIVRSQVEDIFDFFED